MHTKCHKAGILALAPHHAASAWCGMKSNEYNPKS